MLQKCCSCCGEFTLSKGADGETCPICGWTKDTLQEVDPHLPGRLNKKSLAEARDIYFAHRHNHSIF